MTRRARRADPGLSLPPVPLDITGIGGRGDGIAIHDGVPVYVPYTLPGERHLVRLEGRRGEGLAGASVELLSRSAARIAPACRHFGTCGGCALQHWRHDAYLAWKAEQIRLALARRGLEGIPIDPPVAAGPGERRRASFAARRQRDTLLLGFHGRASHRIVPLDMCPVLAPPLAALIAPLREVLAAVLEPEEEAGVIANLTDGGIDLLVEAAREPGLDALETLARFAADAGLARLSWRNGRATTPIAARHAPFLQLGDATVVPPPGAFLQASRGAERAMRALVETWLSGADSTIDLYAGIGTLSLGQPALGRLHLVEGDEAAVAAAAQAARQPQARGRVTVERRDLARQPVPAGALDGHAAAIFDPPRAGAQAQARALAASRVARIVGVSCDPATFARDARILADGGHVLRRVVPLDQFLWSPHVELVGLFARM